MAHKHGAAMIRHIIATLGLMIADQGTGSPENQFDINEAMLNYIDTEMVIADLAAKSMGWCIMCSRNVSAPVLSLSSVDFQNQRFVESQGIQPILCNKS